ncbi:transposase [Bradyrhizobium japonicum]
MFRLASDLRVYLHREPIDFRAGISSLAIVVEQSMGLDPFQRAVFAFCNRRRDRIKLLIYDRSGFWMLLKRLEADRFHWPRSQEAVLTLTTEELHWLLDGINIAAVPSSSGAAISERGLSVFDAGGVIGLRHGRSQTPPKT